MPSLGPAEILVILVIALLVFGPNKMPEIAKQVGKGFREFRRVQQHLKSELRDVVAEFDSPSASPSVEQQAVPMLPPSDDAGSTPAAEAPPVQVGDPLPTFPEPPPTPTPPPRHLPTLPTFPEPPAAATPTVDATPPSPEPDAPSAPA